MHNHLPTIPNNRVANAAEALALTLVECEPMAIMRAFAKGLKYQTAGAQSAIIRRLVDE
jgi:hypothetical protein